MYYYMDSGPKFTGLLSLNAGGIVLDHISFRFWIFCMFWPQFSSRGGAPELLDLHYKIDADTDHVAKFRGDLRGS